MVSMRQRYDKVQNILEDMIVPEGPNSLVERMNELTNRVKKLKDEQRQFQLKMTMPISRVDSDDEATPAQEKKFNPFPGRLKTIISKGSTTIKEPQKGDKDLNVIDESELLKDIGLKKIYLHPFSQAVRQGKYFQVPSRSQIETLAEPAQFYESIELDSIQYQKEQDGQGIVLPALAWSSSESSKLIQTSLGKMRKGQVETLELRTGGFDVESMTVRYTENRVRLLVIQTTEESLKAVMQTSYKDGLVKTTKMEKNQEIVGFFGYVNSRGEVMGFGIVVSDH